MTDPQRYRSVYLAALPPGPRKTRLALPPQIDAKHFYLQTTTHEARQFSLPQLYVAGVQCGHGEARMELKRRVAAFEADFERFRGLRARVEDDRNNLAEQLATVHRESLAHQVHADNLERFLIEARTRVNALETSTTWRVTAPLRRGAHRVKIELSRLRANVALLRHSPRYASLALTILRDEGGGALARRVRQRITRGRRFVPAHGTLYRPEPVVLPMAFVPCSEPR